MSCEVSAVIHPSMSTPVPYGAGSEISGDLILVDAEYSLGLGEFENIRAFNMKFYIVILPSGSDSLN